MTPTRRDLLKAGGALIVSFSLGGPLTRRARAQSTEPKTLDRAQVDAFLAIHDDGSVTIYSGKIDCGTGLRIAIPQMVSEELGVPITRIRIIDGDTAVTPDQGSTGGSSGLTRGGTEVRRAAAQARLTLLNMAATRLNTPAAALDFLGTEIRPRTGGTGVTIADLTGGRRLNAPMDQNVPLKDPSKYTVVGQPLPRPDLPGKVTGRHTYVQDIVVPGMLHARVIRPPMVGATLASVDDSALRAIPGARLVRVRNFLAAVAPDEWAAIRASQSVRATWTNPQPLPGNNGLEQYIRSGPRGDDQTPINRGDTATALPTAAKTISATYMWPNQSHASLGPSCAVADVRPGGAATIWTSTQGPHAARQNLARIFDLDEANTQVVFVDGAGSYGGNGNDDAAADAVLISRSIGAPVRVQWMRHDEHLGDPKGPQQLLDVRAGIDQQGNIVAWETEMWVPANKPGGRPLTAAQMAGIPQPQGQGAGLLTQNADPPYTAPNVRVTVHNVLNTPLKISNIRAPGKIANVFAVESMVDRLASTAGIDPIEYRLRGLDDDRAIEAITRVKELFDWQTRPSPNPNTGAGQTREGRGMAYVHYKQSENYVALAMAVAVNPREGTIDVQRIACAHDCGLVVNPDALRNQIEGCILQTLSRALYEEVKFDDQRLLSADWNSYPILRFPQAPPVEVALIDRPNLPLFGAGEAATAPVAAALANAVFDATGVMITRVPFTPDRLKLALEAV